MKHKPKLELTWIGKDEQPRLEPRILIEDPEKSYGYKNSGNMLIHGDNLLALKALEQDFAGKVKCIYIDPPFNTGARIDADGKEIGYDDGLEHSEWLNMMYARLELLKALLSTDGSIFIHIDDTEIAYLIAICDEIFGRNNRLPIITIKRGSVTGPKVINPGVVNLSDYIIIYAKERLLWKPNRVYRQKQRDSRYSKFILNRAAPPHEWKFITLLEAFADFKKVPLKNIRRLNKNEREKEIEAFVLNNAECVVRTAALDNSKISKEALELKSLSKKSPGEIFILEREDYENWYIVNGERILFYSDRLSKIDGDLVPGELISNIWDDVLPNDLHNEGQVTFKKGKKPEKLIKRILELATRKGDLVLDSFAGSGTTGAVANKMERKWILCELSTHCDTHALQRLKRVVNADDQSGITKDVNWQGGGGFKYYYLAPSLLKQDKYGNWIIDERYNANMLAAAMAKHEGFKYSPDEHIYWKQGKSTEKDYIFTTTNFITVEFLDKINEEMQPDESLLICCKSFSKACGNRYPNITVKKIPNLLLGRCEFGREDYSLNIVNMPVEENNSEPTTPYPSLTKEGSKDGAAKNKKAPRLF